MTIDERLELRARFVRARRGWLRIEDDGAGLDEELDQRIAIARLAILDAVDRIDQLLDVVEAGGVTWLIAAGFVLALAAIVWRATRDTADEQALRRTAEERLAATAERAERRGRLASATTSGATDDLSGRGRVPPMTAKQKPLTRSIRRGRGHSYELDGEKVQGVTTVISNGVPKGALTNWAARTAAEYAVDHWAELTAVAISDRLERIRTAPDRARNEGGERGREVHELVRRYLAGDDVTPPDDLRGHFEAGVRFEEEWRPAEIAVEFAVFARPSQELGRPRGYGGRSDLLARLADGQLWLLDWKTALKGVFADNALQLAAYRYADFYVVDGDVDEAGQFVEHPMPPVDRTGIVWLRADGYDLVPVEADHRALEVFTAAQEVAAFTKSDRDDWIHDALRPPAPELEAVA